MRPQDAAAWVYPLVAEVFHQSAQTKILLGLLLRAHHHRNYQQLQEMGAAAVPAQEDPQAEDRLGGGVALGHRSHHRHPELEVGGTAEAAEAMVISKASDVTYMQLHIRYARIIRNEIMSYRRRSRFRRGRGWSPPSRWRGPLRRRSTYCKWRRAMAHNVDQECAD